MSILDATPQTFNWPTIITSILGSGSLAAIITLFTSNRVKKNEFEWDYKKYILDRRKGTYETIYPLLLKIFDFKVDEKGEKRCGFFELPSEEMTKISNEIVDAIIYREWLSLEFDQFISELNKFIVESIFKLQGLEANMKTKYAYSAYPSMLKSRSSLFKLYWRDVSKLHDINAFMKSKK